MQLYRVTAGHFCAGFIASPAGDIVAAAPILVWLVGRSVDYARLYCGKKRWTFEHLG